MSDEHGGYHYGNDGCRCKECTKAHRENVTRARMRRAERLRKDPSLAPHGDASTYCNWVCRCDPCRTAHTAKSRERKQRRAAEQQG